MENTGNFTSTLATGFLFFLLLPTFCRILQHMIGSFGTTTIIIDSNNEDYIPAPVINHTVNYGSEAPKKKKQKKKKQKKEDISSVFGIEKIQPLAETDRELRDNCHKALMKLGYKSREAKGIVAKLCIQKCYESEDDLLKDCLKGK